MNFRNGEYPTLFVLEEELKQFGNYFMEHGPDGPNRRAIMSEFIQKSLSDAAQIFVSNLVNELSLQ